MKSNKSKLKEFTTYEAYIRNYFPHSYQETQMETELSSEEIGVYLARRSISKVKRTINRTSKKNTQQKN